MNVLNERLKAMKMAAEMNNGDDHKGLIEELSALQRTMTDISVQLKAVVETLNKGVAKG